MALLYEVAPTTALRSPATPASDVKDVADRVMDAGDITLWRDDYDKRMDVFAREIAGRDRAFQAALIEEILRQDPGAFESWLKADRLDGLVEDGRVSRHEREETYAGFRQLFERSGAFDGDAIPAGFVRDSHDPALIASYLAARDLDDPAGFERALTAFSGIPAGQIADFIRDPGNAAALHSLEMGVQRHQDWYENLTMSRITQGSLGYGTVVEARVEFSREQLAAMREGFLADDNLHTNGELLLAYPDRVERNERVTAQYHELSTGMSRIVGTDNANWATFAVWASDEIGRNLDGNFGIALGEAAFNDPRYWLSKGNTMLNSDIGPLFRHFNDTFADGRNRDMSFEEFWSGFEARYEGRGISFLEGRNDPQNDMKNAFKAYYESMKLHDREQGATGAERQALAARRSDLMLYANTLVGLQEQDIVDRDVNEGMKAFGITNPFGSAGWALDFHLPGRGGQGERRIDTDIDMGNTGARVDPSGTRFTTVDGDTIDIAGALRERLNGLDGNPGNENEFDPGNSGTRHWESYSQRMGTIYHLFANYQRDPEMFRDPREVFGSRAETLDHNPIRP